MARFVVLFCIILYASAYNYVVNGDFEQPFAQGWQESYNGAEVLLSRDTLYDPDPDYEAYIYKGGSSGYVRLSQDVAIPLIELTFFVNAKILADDNNVGAWSGAAVVLAYLDGNDTVLGETRIYQGSEGCPWVNSQTLHLIPAPDTNWNNYTFNLIDELTNVPAVIPSEIKKIRVALYDTTEWC
jgi:hypothetical protein